MQVGILTTDGGPHPADKWALATAGQIVQIAPTASGTNLVEARNLETKIIDILHEAHKKIEALEAKMLGDKGTERLSDDYGDIDPYVTDSLPQIIAASKGTPFESHFAKPEVQSHIAEVVASHLASNSYVHRSVEADKHPHDKDEHTKNWHARKVGHLPPIPVKIPGTHGPGYKEPVMSPFGNPMAPRAEPNYPHHAQNDPTRAS